MEREGLSNSKMGSLVGDAVSSLGTSRLDQSEPIVVGSHTWADSDTEMEDDITQADSEPGVNYSTGAPKCYSNMIPGKLDNKEQLPGAHASSDGHQIQWPVNGFNSSNFYPQGNMYVSTEPSPKEKNADRSKQEADFPNSTQTHNLPISGRGDMYDPFLDCIEPSPNSYEKFSHVQKYEPAGDSNTIPKLDVSFNKPPNIEENNRGKGVGVVFPETSMDSEECGENMNAGAVVGSVETGSPNSPDELEGTNTNPSEVERGRKMSREKRKNKESRSMRLFKVVLTQFVKDLLKPSWRQGNMSKEAFKTIVKKTVDKVSRAMEGRQIPKSQEKIDRYIDSSQQKLTKLVMGYVDKYVKT